MNDIPRTTKVCKTIDGKTFKLSGGKYTTAVCSESKGDDGTVGANERKVEGKGVVHDDEGVIK